jgi:hypothetical protein
LLIDLDNCPKQIDHLPQTLAGFTRVIACYGGNEPKVHLSLVPFLAAAIHEGKLEIVGMKKKGKNAADFGLAFWAGRLLADMPPDTTFLILSQDTDLDHVVHLLHSAERQAERLDGKVYRPAALATSAEEAPHDSPMTAPTDEDAIREYAMLYLQPGRSRPAKKTTLANSIKSFFKNRKKSVRADDILQGLTSRGLVRIDAQGRVTYPDVVSTESDPTPAETRQGDTNAHFDTEGVIPF